MIGKVTPWHQCQGLASITCMGRVGSMSTLIRTWWLDSLIRRSLSQTAVQADHRISVVWPGCWPSRWPL